MGYDRSRELFVPFLAGSSLPLTWRRPPLKLPLGCELAEAVQVGYGPEAGTYPSGKVVTLAVGEIYGLGASFSPGNCFGYATIKPDTITPLSDDSATPP